MPVPFICNELGFECENYHLVGYDDGRYLCAVQRTAADRQGTSAIVWFCLNHRSLVTHDGSNLDGWQNDGEIYVIRIIHGLVATS